MTNLFTQNLIPPQIYKSYEIKYLIYISLFLAPVLRCSNNSGPTNSKDKYPQEERIYEGDIYYAPIQLDLYLERLRTDRDKESFLKKFKEWSDIGSQKTNGNDRFYEFAIEHIKVLDKYHLIGKPSFLVVFSNNEDSVYRVYLPKVDEYCKVGDYMGYGHYDLNKKGHKIHVKFEGIQIDTFAILSNQILEAKEVPGVTLWRKFNFN